MYQIRAQQALTIPRPQPHAAADEGLAEIEALNALLAGLPDDEWDRPTASEGWTVRDVVAHLVGQHIESARPWTIPGKLRQARRRFPGRSALDAHNALHILEYAGRTPEELRQLLVRFGSKAVRARQHMPRVIRRQSFARFFPEEHLPDLSFAYLLDVLSNRDTWMHRLEIARATGRPFTTGEHDRGIVIQVLRDLAQTWVGPSIALVLTGSVVGKWTLGVTEPVAVVRTDTVDYLWCISGREGLPALDIDGDSDVASAIVDARVDF